MWKETDPRDVLCCHKGYEIIVFTGFEASLAIVDTKGATNPWNVWVYLGQTSRCLDVDMAWPGGWLWTPAPRGQYTGLVKDLT